jgi:arylsulfatase A-like enzyme
VNWLRRILDSPWLYFGLAAVLLIVAVASQFEIHLPTRPQGSVADLRQLQDRDDLNVVFILIDTLRADRLGCYGYERDTSPTLDLIASTGVRFAHVQSQSSWTKSSMASLWTSSYPARAGILRYPDTVAQEALLPAEVLSAHGFKTAGIYRNGWVDPNFGFGQGFDIYLKPRPSLTPARFQRRNPSTSPLQGTDLDATESAIEFLRGHARDRFFLYVHYMDVHQYLYDDEAALFGTSLSDAYDNAIRWVDRNVSAVVGQLEEQGLLGKTLVVIAADHGESFYEHGEEGHARTLYREVTETPLILMPPFRIEGGLVVEHRVENVDIWPTVFDLLGIEAPAGADGESLVPLVEAAAAGDPGSDAEGSDITFAELDRSWGQNVPAIPSRPIVAMVDGNYRMIRHAYGKQRVELYDRSVDPLEQENIAGRDPELTRRLDDKIDAFLEQGPRWESKPVELDEMRFNQLRALGYFRDNK